MSPDAPPVPIQFEFVSLAIPRVLFEFVGTDTPQQEQRPITMGIRFDVAAAVRVATDGTGAFLRLDTKITPDQKWQPYQIEVSIAAAFRAENASTDDLLAFCRIAAPSILFPYIRETVHRITMDAPNGPVRLNPMNMAQLLNQTDWVIAGEDITSASTAPPQPSAQSPSASSDSKTQP